MKVTFYGACGEVGRSLIRVDGDPTGKKNIILDAGVKLGEEVEYPLLTKDEIKRDRINNFIITHAHLDHAGYLPHIINRGMNIFTTKPTRDLMQLLLADYQRLQKEKRFSSKDVNLVMSRIKQTEYRKRFTTNGFQITLHDAGHIIGSSMIRIRRGNKILLYTGDINDRESRLLSGCEMGLRAHTLIIEGTYSGKRDRLPSMKRASKELIEIIRKTLNRGGKVLIPSFAVGRGQEVLLLLNDYIRSGAIPEVPIYVDGMIKKALRIHRYNVIFAKREVQLRILMSDEDPFKSPYFTSSVRRNRSDVIESGPCIIVTTSGMLTGGPVLTYFKHLAPDPKNTLILVGYQAEGTLGRQLLEGLDRVTLRIPDLKGRVDEVDVDVRMEIANVHLSAHADRQGLIKFINSLRGLKKIYLVHGEKRKLEEFSEYLSKRYDVIIPELGESYKV